MTQMIIKGIFRKEGHRNSDKNTWKKGEEVEKEKEKNGKGGV